MSDWKKITPTSPTEEECKRGVLLGKWGTERWLVAEDLGFNRDKFTHYIVQPTPPPRPDPAKEACERAANEHFSKPSSAFPIRGEDFQAGWHAALAWKEGNK